MTQTAPEVGQVWEDLDPRSTGRHIKILEINGPSAGHPNTAKVTPCDADGHEMRGRISWIRLNRFRPTANGYRHVGWASGA